MLDPATRLLENRAKLSDHIGQINGSYGSYDALNYGARARKTAENYANYRSWNSMGAAFEAESLKEDDDSGDSTPPLWRASPPTSPQHRANHYRSLSPSSRTQAIARGQKELMEMVSKMPESCYELSLKDIVERPMVEAKQERLEEEKSMIISHNENMYKKEKKMMNDTKKVVMKRSESIDSAGLLLKMVFPISFGSKKKKKNKNNDSVTNNSSKVSPKPPVSDGSSKAVDKEWWKKRFSVSSESENGGSSSNNSGSTKSSGSSSRSSSTRSNSRHGSGGCWSFILTKKSKSAE